MAQNLNQSPVEDVDQEYDDQYDLNNRSGSPYNNQNWKETLNTRTKPRRGAGGFNDNVSHSSRDGVESEIGGPMGKSMRATQRRKRGAKARPEEKKNYRELTKPERHTDKKINCYRDLAFELQRHGINIVDLRTKFAQKSHLPLNQVT